MITAKLQGGLGNYMFQIAAAESLGVKHNDSVVFSETDCTSCHANVSKYKFDIFRNVNISHQPLMLIKYDYDEPKFSYDELPYRKDMRLVGYFQSEKYFNEDKIRDLFRAPKQISDFIDENYNWILVNPTCSIHVRRGDYLNLPNHHPTCSMDYYKKAMEIMPEGTKYLVFSDDIQWCKENFIGEEFEFVEGLKDVVDLYLMSSCDNNIIANSTFSWWGAWLNNNEDKIVVAPKLWFGPAKNNFDTKDIIPDKWIRL